MWGSSWFKGASASAAQIEGCCARPSRQPSRPPCRHLYVRKIAVVVFIAATASASGYALGWRVSSARTLKVPAPGPTVTATISASPSPTTGRDAPWLYRGADRSKRWILQWFAEVEEEQLPSQGVLGGEIRPWTIVFLEGFTGDKDDRYFVSGSDGHFGEWWVYPGDRVNEPELICPSVEPIPDECPGRRFSDKSERLAGRGFDVWDLLPSYYVRRSPQS